MITIDDFKKLNIVVGTVEAVEEIEGSEKLYKFSINIGKTDPETSLPALPAGRQALRQVLGGLKPSYKKEDLLGKQVLVLANLEPRKMMGLESQGMILAASDEDRKPIIISPLEPVPNGTIIG